jgi:hypothetical protein
MPIEIDKRTKWIGGGVLLGAVAGAAAWWLTRVETPAYTLVLKDGAIEVRAYGALRVAQTHTSGLRQPALEAGFRTLADYIFANSRTGERVAMTAPVLSDDQDGDWRTRFILPARYDEIDPPVPPKGVSIETVPPRRVAAIRFSGRADDAMLADREAELRDWLQTYGLKATGPAEHAFYNPPIVPGPLRHNEVLLPVASIY